MDTIDFSIIIPTLNGQKTIGSLIIQLEKSARPFKIEIIVIDSNSDDKTLHLLHKLQSKYNNIQIYNISRSLFNHGETRNFGVSKSKGKYICFFSQDAIPLSKKMFLYFIESFERNKRVVAIFGKQVPYTFTPLLQEIETERDFILLDKHAKEGIVTFDLKNPFIPYTDSNLFLWYFLSDVCSCYPREFLLLNKFSFIDHGEDIMIGKKIIENNLIKIYDNRIVVRHSHSYNYFDYYKRELANMRLEISVLKLKKRSNLLKKIAIIRKWKAPIYNKILCFIDLGILYCIKLFILFQLKVLK